jgi:branched-subunit amino acid transport protein AzlD
MKFLKQLGKQLYISITTMFTVAFFLEIGNTQHYYSIGDIIIIASIITYIGGYGLLQVYDISKNGIK